jgi:hypothetical protein
MTKQANDMKRYNLALPQTLFDEIQSVAEKRQTTVVEMLRRFIKLGLLVDELENSPDSAFIIREGDREKEVLLY